MSNRHDWLLKKNLRTVDNLRLWNQNPRLDPENIYLTTRDFAEEITNTDADRNSFLEIVKSIVKRGFIPADPIVVWQNEENQKYYVAEGNRRILALKLLRKPSHAPRSIKGIITKLSTQIDTSDFDKIPVSIAPTFEDAEWYISQRHSTSSLQKKWSSEQQLRWIAELYEKYQGNIDAIKSIIDTTESELQSVIRILKLKSFVKEIQGNLSESEFKLANSHNFPITTLDRFFNFASVREKWGIEYDAYNIEIKNEASFLNAFTELIKRIILPRGDNNRIDSRVIRTAQDAENILDTLPIVDRTQPNENINLSQPIEPVEVADNDIEDSSTTTDTVIPENEEERRQRLKNDTNRIRIICEFYTIETDSQKLISVFNELKTLPLKYKNAVAASLRIFLDLAVLKYIETENLESEISQLYRLSLRDINLKRRVEFIKNKQTDQKLINILSRLLNNANEYSLDVLNGYVHSQDTHYLSLQFLNGFWDFLFPLFQKLVVIKED